MKTNINTWTPGAITDCGSLHEVFTDDLDLYRFCASHDKQWAGFILESPQEGGDFWGVRYMDVDAHGTRSLARDCAESLTAEEVNELNLDLKERFYRSVIVSAPRESELKWWREVFNNCRPETGNDNMVYRTLAEIEDDLLDNDLRDNAQSLIDAIKEATN